MCQATSPTLCISFIDGGTRPSNRGLPVSSCSLLTVSISNLGSPNTAWYSRWTPSYGPQMCCVLSSDVDCNGLLPFALFSGQDFITLSRETVMVNWLVSWVVNRGKRDKRQEVCITQQMESRHRPRHGCTLPVPSRMIITLNSCKGRSVMTALSSIKSGWSGAWSWHRRLSFVSCHLPTVSFVFCCCFCHDHYWAQDLHSYGNNICKQWFHILMMSVQ